MNAKTRRLGMVRAKLQRIRAHVHTLQGRATVTWWPWSWVLLIMAAVQAWRAQGVAIDVDRARIAVAKTDSYRTSRRTAYRDAHRGRNF